MKLKISNILLPLFFFICFSIGVGRISYLEYFAVTVIIAGMLLDQRTNIIVYLAAFLPWYPSIGTRYAEMIVFSFILIYSIRTSTERNHEVDITSLGFLFAAIVSCIIGVFVNIGNVIQYAIPVYLVLFVCLRQLEKEDTVKIARVFAISCVLCAIMACFGSAFPKLIKYTDQYVFYNVSDYLASVLQGKLVRFSSLDTDANFSSYNFLMATAMLYLSCQKNEEKLLIVDKILIVLMLVFGAFSISVTYYIVAFAFIANIILFSDKRKGIIFCVVGIVLFIIASFIFKDFFNEFYLLYSSRLGEADIGERSRIWMLYWNETVRNPFSILFGNGAMAKLNITSHSTLFRLLYMNGFIGFISIMLFVTKHITKFAFEGHRKFDLFLLPMIIIFIAYNLVLDAMRENGVYMMMFYIIIIYFMYGDRGVYNKE